MKKFKLLFLILTLIFSLSLGVACGNNSGDGDGDGDTPTGPVIANVEGTKGLAYEVETPKKGSPYAICTGIGTATDTDIVIASHYEGYVVEQVKANAFKNNEQIKSVTFVNGMQKLNMYAFQGCTSLFSVSLCETLENIGQNAFFQCENLLNICNDSQLELKMGSIQYGYVANYACNIYSSTSGTKGEFKTEGDYEYFTFPNNKFAMKYNGSASVIEIPAGVTGLYKDLFKDNVSLKEISLPGSLKSIGKTAFNGCTSLEKITIAENSNLQDVGELAFFNCEALKEFNFNSTLEDYLKIKYVSNSSNPMFYTKSINLQGKPLLEFSIPQGVKEIGAHAFTNNAEITKVLISPSVEVIGTGAFATCQNLKFFWFTDIANSKLRIIMDSAFDNSPSLEAIELPKSLEVIEITAFRQCNGLLTVTIANDSKLTEIKERAFYNCKNLQTVHLGHNSSITIIGREAFRDCPKMTAFNMGNNCKVKRIETFAFYQCRKLREFYVPSTVEFIGNYTFGGCFDGPRNGPNTYYMKIYLDFPNKPVAWGGEYNSSSCPVFYNTPYPTYPV